MANRPLKVFRTSIGFQDAYVAASSRKAALQHWGADKDLFASGAAELVTDPELAKAPLAQPGVVIRVARGTTEQHIAAAGAKRKPAKPRSRSAETPAASKAKARPPRPSRAKLDEAERKLEKEEAAQARSLKEIEAQIEGLRQERDDLRSNGERRIAELLADRDQARNDYRHALDRWEG